ncbi:hypothetical protein Nepgr_030201 [Nepenthes gracilis]|uniref:Uncharacterized protein n=1 Tax=Nepenthes gracilis TaxID=150966 RepID=A0AAD3TG11_NEPGR|nr:hypothetical protein Nepgr_030201 [Nepenthes gracilis]
MPSSKRQRMTSKMTRYVYVWHALGDYWASVKLAASGMEPYNTASIGISRPVPRCHGIDGVKVDVQNIIETLGAGHGSRVALTGAYPQALEASIALNFSDNRCIACMCHNTDAIFSAKQTAVVRVSDHFGPVIQLRTPSIYLQLVLPRRVHAA